MKMATLKSHTEEGKKYFFEGFGFKKDTIEEVTNGKLISSLEISLDTDYLFNKDFKNIIEDCCPPEISSKGIENAFNYIKSFGWSKTQKTMYVHTIQE